MESKPNNTFSYWTVVPGANVGKVPIPSRFVESTQGSERYRTVCHNDGDLKQGAKDFSLCMKHQQGTCRMGERCHQLHVSPDFFTATKFWEEVRRTCCARHEDFNSRSDDFVSKINTYKFEVMGVPGAGGCCPVEGALLARTAGLMEMIKTRPANDPRPIQFSVRQICRLHINDECRFGRDCGRIHVCRDFVNRELPLPPVPRKKGKEGGHVSPTPSFGMADAMPAAPHATAVHAPNANTSWMRGMGMNANVNANALNGMMNFNPAQSGQQVLQPMQPTLAQLQQAAALNAFLGSRMAALNPIDVNKMQQANMAANNANSGIVKPQQQHQAFRSYAPNNMAGRRFGGMENPGTPVSTPGTPGSLPNVVRSVVDMTLCPEAEAASEIRRRQAQAHAALAALNYQTNSQNINPNNFMRGNFGTHLTNQKFMDSAPKVAPTNGNVSSFNPTTAPSRPLGDLTNKNNFMSVSNQNTNNNMQSSNNGGAIGGNNKPLLSGVTMSGMENTGAGRDYSMFDSGRPLLFSFDA